MKQVFTILSAVLLANTLVAQEQAEHKDTLHNHDAGAVLNTDKYTGTGQWGYYAGMNSKHQEEFGERYEITEHGDVIGVIVHVKGVVAHDNHEAHVRIRQIANDGKPGAEVKHGHVHFDDFNLDGKATYVALDAHAHVHDGFFATLDFGDYAHGGYEGDTIGVLYAADGARKATDLDKLYRNVVRIHSHGSPSWIDFYTENSTPLATHFAIYPVIEFEEDDDHGKKPEVGIKEASNGIVSFSSPYPNPTTGSVSVPFSISASSDVKLSVLDLTGKELLSENLGRLSSGSYEHALDLSPLSKGAYIVAIQTTNGALAVKISKQ